MLVYGWYHQCCFNDNDSSERPKKGPPRYYHIPDWSTVPMAEKARDWGGQSIQAVMRDISVDPYIDIYIPSGDV